MTWGAINEHELLQEDVEHNNTMPPWHKLTETHVTVRLCVAGRVVCRDCHKELDERQRFLFIICIESHVRSGTGVHRLRVLVSKNVLPKAGIMGAQSVFWSLALFLWGFGLGDRLWHLTTAKLIGPTSQLLRPPCWADSLVLRFVCLSVLFCFGFCVFDLEGFGSVKVAQTAPRFT